jgi:uncharacterized membrane protein
VTARREAGSILPLTLLAVLIALLLIAGTAATSAAFLAQRDLQAWCDGAALSAAGAPGGASLYTERATEPVLAETAGAGLDRYLAEAPRPGAAVRLSVQGERVTVVCATTVDLPFGRLFGISNGLRREAVSSARIRWSA